MTDRLTLRRAAPSLLAIVLISPIGASAQVGIWARSAAMAGADVAFGNGVRAIEWNPSNLAIRDSAKTFGLGFPLHTVNAVVSGSTLSDLAEILRSTGGGDPAILDRLHAEGVEVTVVAEGLTATTAAEALGVPDPAGRTQAPSFGFLFDSFGIAVRRQTVVEANVSRELADLAVNGFNPERVDEYSSKNTRFRSFTVLSFTLATGRQFGRVTVGAALRFVRGKALVQGRLFEPAVDLDLRTISVPAAGVRVPSGSGYGMDLSVGYQWTPTVRVSIVGHNVVQRMTWSSDLEVFETAFTDEDFDTANLKELLGRFRAEDLVEQATSLEVFRAADGLFDESFFPRVIRVAAGYDTPWNGTAQFMAATTIGRGSMPMPWAKRVAIGVSQPASFFDLRAGLGADRGGAREATFGFGVGGKGVSLDLFFGKTWGQGAGGRNLAGLSGGLGISMLIQGS